MSFGVSAVVDIAAVQQAVVLAMRHNQLAQRLGALHGLPHPVRVLDALAVIGESHYIGGHGFQIRQRLPLFPLRNRAVGQDPHHRVLFDGIQLRSEVFQAVRHRVQVRHGTHHGIAAVGRR